MDIDYSTDQVTSVMDKLLVGLGFGSGYLAQGGDIGSTVCLLLAAHYDSCKGAHRNMMNFPPPENKDELPIDELEKRAMARGAEFMNTGVSYAQEHGMRTATIGLTLSASPLAMLSWIGEKFLEWTDEDPPVEKILESVTLYWMTDTFPRCIYPYRGVSRALLFRLVPWTYSTLTRCAQNGAGDSKPKIAQMNSVSTDMSRRIDAI